MEPAKFLIKNKIAKTLFNSQVVKHYIKSKIKASSKTISFLIGRLQTIGVIADSIVAIEFQFLIGRP
jgi:hypothetical protein